MCYGLEESRRNQQSQEKARRSEVGKNISFDDCSKGCSDGDNVLMVSMRNPGLVQDVTSDPTVASLFWFLTGRCFTHYKVILCPIFPFP